ncbi:MAG: hypothetical protein EHM83_07340, partial [Burkholderiales bacterium]
PAAATGAATAPAAARPAAAPAGAPGELTVRAGDTLAGIAARVKPADVALEQAIVAIYNANPDAFFGNVHQMYAGKRIAVPDRSAMAAVDAAAARRQIRVEAAEFRAYRERLAAAARRVEPAQAGQTAAGTVTARVEDSAAGAAAGDQLRLSRSQGAAGQPAAAAGGATGGSDAAGAAETRVARDAAVREQQERVAALEKNVTDLQQLVELKNSQLAELQRQVESARAAGTTASGTVGPTGAAPDAAGAASTAAGQPASASAPAAPAADAAPATPAAADAQPPATTPPVAAAPPAATTPAPAPAPVSAPSFVDELMGNPLTLPGLGAIALAIGAYGLYSVRRRRKAEKFEDDSLMAADAFTANSLFGSTGGQAVDTSHSLFPTSTRDSGVDVHSTEVDPIAEAEVYIAYGREAQAEEILKEALKKQPERQAIRLKLLEIHAGRKDAAAFGAVAQDMYDMTGGQNEEWPKVVTLGLSIDPANPLYTGEGDMSGSGGGAPSSSGGSAQAAGAGGATRTQLSGAAGLAAAAGAAAAMFGDRLTSDQEAAEPPRAATTGSFAETVPMDGEGAEGDEMATLDFDLDLDTTIGRSASMREAAGTPDETPAPSESDLSRAIDGRFDLPSLDVETGQPDFTEEQPPTQAASPAIGAIEDEAPALADLGDFKIDLPSLEDLDLRAGAGTGLGAGRARDAEFSGDVGLAAAETEVAPAVDSSRWQEMATKLDLASAYEEIGDKEGARELLEEVLKGGDAAQQQKARSMLSKIG